MQRTKGTLKNWMEWLCLLFTVDMKEMHGTRLFYMQPAPQVLKHVAFRCNSEYLGLFSMTVRH